MNRIRTILVLAATMALAGACAGVSNPFAAATPSTQDQMLKYAQCMRAHGVNMSDPVNGRITIQGGSTPNSNGGDNSGGTPSQAIQAAQQACQKYLPNGDQGGRPSQADLDAMTKFAQCMRAHGIPVQDPQVGSNGTVQGSELNKSQVDPNQLQAAQQACQHYMPTPPPGSRTTRGGS